MKKLVFLIFWMVSVNAYANDAPTVLILGDSLSAGYGIDADQSWPSLLQQRLEQEGYAHRVVNASISGETTEGGAERIGSALERFNPDVVVIELGGNDGLRGFPPDRTRANLASMVDASRASGAAVALLGIRIPPNYGPRYTRAFEAVFGEIAEQYSLPWIEFFLEGIALNDALMQDDGIHPTAEAQPIMLDNAWPVIDKALKSLEETD
ncbi:MAG: arylesterase [Pseudomonadota bacterium]